MKSVVVSWKGRCRELVVVGVEWDVLVGVVERSSWEVPGWAGRSELPLEVVELADSCTGQLLCSVDLSCTGSWRVGSAEG